MTAYNEEENWIRESVASILDQTYRNLRLYLLLDNPANERLKCLLAEYARRDERVTFHVNDVNMGLVDSLNKLLGMVSEPLVARMDADDVADVRRLERELAFMEEHNLDFAMSDVDFLVDGSVEPGPVIPLLLPEDMAQCEKYGNVSTHPTWLLKREVYERLGGYRNLRYCEDYDLVLRALQQGFRLGRLNEVLLHYRLRDSGITKTYAYEQYEKARAIRRAYARGERVQEIDVEAQNMADGHRPKRNRERFEQAKRRLDAFSADLYRGNYGRCMVNLLGGFFTSGYYRRLFCETFYHRIKMDRIYRGKR